MEWENDVKVEPTARFRNPVRERRDEPRQSRAQQRLDQILTDAESELREARDLIVTALEDLSLILQPQHPNLPTLLGQQIEQVIQFRATSSKVER